MNRTFTYRNRLRNFTITLLMLLAGVAFGHVAAQQDSAAARSSEPRVVSAAEKLRQLQNDMHSQRAVEFNPDANVRPVKQKKPSTLTQTFEKEPSSNVTNKV